MSNIQEFRKNETHTKNLEEFLATPTGQYLSLCLRGSRDELVKNANYSEAWRGGIHQAFFEMEELLFKGQIYQPPKPKMSERNKHVPPTTTTLPT